MVQMRVIAIQGFCCSHTSFCQLIGKLLATVAREYIAVAAQVATAAITTGMTLGGALGVTITGTIFNNVIESCIAIFRFSISIRRKTCQKE
ncbi:hypothetical protein BDR26DRAFT_851344 [Obelidium mucronatum]|nr:hypothetical protein BDR26DRAFT_851344 [Obelidium mucronatum]